MKVVGPHKKTPGYSNDDIMNFFNDIDALIESDEGGVAWTWSKVSIAYPP